VGLLYQFNWRWSRTAAASGIAFLLGGIASAQFQYYSTAMAFFTGGLLLLGISRALAKLRAEYVHLKNLDILIGTTDSIVITTDRKGYVDGFNPAAERALGYSAQEVIGKLTPRAFHPHDPNEEGSDSCIYAYHQVPGDVAQQEWTYVRKDGTTFPAIVTIGAIRNELGEVIGHSGMGIDISQRKAGEAALREKQELIESIASTSPTIFYIFDLAERRIVYTNRALPATLGYSPEQIAKMGDDPLPSVIHPEDLDILFNRYQSCMGLLDGEILEVEFRCLAADGSLRWQFARDVIFKRDAEGKPTQILVNVVDVTDQRMLDQQIETQVMEIQDTNLALEIQTNALEEANSQLEALAFTDGLTGIANHRSFQEELAKTYEAARKTKRRLSLMLIDVDRFKQYNDTYGHPSGDIVLKRVAATIRDCCPEECLPARYGGEEFAVLCPDFAPAEVLALAEKIRMSIENTPWPDRLVTVSIGAVTFKGDSAAASELVTASDNALYSSKASGRNCVTFYDFQNRSKMAS
jgi:diguanylate cyclase (GGDEF)-like protein/PAS domain S-box-containing protein